ncbi:unnamed protein product [Diamesa hyperborea]
MKKLMDASLMYERGGEYQQAMMSARNILDWQRCIVLAKKSGMSQEDIKDLADICRDSSDDDDDSDASSSRTEGIAIMDVIEFEVPSSSDDDSTSGESSSGTDDFAFEAAAATHALMEYDAIMNKNYEEDDDEFILADTEESDGSCDLELSQHDYWKCVKCNNLQNNPLYRYCERCYQVRKSLFPPRPRRQKSRNMSTTRKMSPPNALERKQSHDSGMSSCQESSQDLSPMENNLARSSSSSSSHSADLYSHTTLEFPHNSQVTEDESDNDNILQRIDEYSRENYNLQQKKMLAKEKGVKYEDEAKVKVQEDASKLGPSRSTDSFDSIEDINESNLGKCRFCMVNPKNGVFVHSNCLHLCCCYKCAVKVWKTRKSCPICNCKIKNVAKLFVH